MTGSMYVMNVYRPSCYDCVGTLLPNNRSSRDAPSLKHAARQLHPASSLSLSALLQGIRLPRTSTMKHLAWLLPLVAPVARAVPANDAQVLLSQLGVGYSDFADQVVEQVGQVLHNANEKVETWMQDGRDYIKQSGLTCELGLRLRSHVVC
jgi:hypothetical protein